VDFGMNILAVDTCLQPGSIALLQEGGEPEVVALPPGWRSVALHEEIERLLARHNLTIADIDLYAVTAGPGAFTGVRLGLTAVKGLAEVYNKPIVPVSTLEALAANGSDEWRVTSDEHDRTTPEPLVIAPVLDARRGQVFGAVYAGEGNEMRPVIPDTICFLGSFLEQIQSAGLARAIRFCVTEEALLLPAIEEHGWDESRVVCVSPDLAGTVAHMAVARFRQGKGVLNPVAADANYIRASDAELFWKE
jgi:tRNA threonylcarbamoyladenosine biosynthesis protein TsaB